jgi:DNA-nicking Smr family endonuclease
VEGEEDIQKVEIDGILDLHQFHPRDVKDLVNHYIDCCAEKGISTIRIIHGKGIGVLKDRVHAILKSRKDVARYGLDTTSASGWGATVVWMKKPSE